MLFFLNVFGFSVKLMSINVGGKFQWDLQWEFPLCSAIYIHFSPLLSLSNVCSTHKWVSRQQRVNEKERKMGKWEWAREWEREKEENSRQEMYAWFNAIIYKLKKQGIIASSESFLCNCLKEWKIKVFFLCLVFSSLRLVVCCLKALLIGPFYKPFLWPWFTAVTPALLLLLTITMARTGLLTNKAYIMAA